MTRELAFIERLRALATHPAARGLNDDCAVLPLGSETLILTHDMLVEGIHYLPGADMDDVAWKLVATNLSDLAAKGAEPIGVLLGHMLGPGDGDFLRGLEDVLSHYGVPLLGGDTTSGGPPRADGLTAVGKATFTPVPSRSGAQPGDAIYITGPVGAAMMGFEALRDGLEGDSAAFRRPMARLAEGQALAPYATAMMDVSDGLLLDACRMARASAVSMSLAGASVPLGCPSGRLLDALRWGDDYELLFTAPETTPLPVPAHRIGTVLLPEHAPLLLDGTPLSEADDLGYQHG
ncbi:thiamine-monophosphate kinase [Erythrobacter sp. SG61-1L]|uniref:thiamine-phosphate kinase n=1 Tax=Erythrobacter sp. SG61-1L TaxID=1603897 RepID=UPI0006C9112A|nr:thiamine-phosphate kinase [Erythrobacter sp. SG61-1L]KPL67018.1 thiamine-monophosphate kinase [Erythrobacter sp. SG61-1L]